MILTVELDTKQDYRLKSISKIDKKKKDYDWERKKKCETVARFK